MSRRPKNSIDRVTQQVEALDLDLREFTPDELHTVRTVVIGLGRTAGASTEEIRDQIRALGLPTRRDIWPEGECPYPLPKEEKARA